MNHRKIYTLIIYLTFFQYHAFSQEFKLPEIPAYDSVYVDSYKDKVLEKSFFQEGQKVFEIGYNTGFMFYTPFFHIGGGKEDSCYAYFNGENHDQYDFYYIDEDYIINNKYAENSNVFEYRKFQWNNVPILTGNSYFIKEMYEQSISHCDKYKIGKWIKYDNTGNPILIIDYDQLTVNYQPIVFSGNLKIIDSLKTLANNKIISVYGEELFSKHIRFNLDQSGYHEVKKPRPEQPGGLSLLQQTDKEIHFVDLSYDIIIGKERFNIIQFRVSNKGEFLGRTSYSNFTNKDFYHTLGLDSLNNGKFHPNIINWKKIAQENGFDITSGDFNVRLKFVPKNDVYGELRMVLEQVTESISTEYSFTNKLKQLIINPWTGEISKDESEEGIESAIIEEPE